MRGAVHTIGIGQMQGNMKLKRIISFLAKVQKATNAHNLNFSDLLLLIYNNKKQQASRISLSESPRRKHRGIISTMLLIFGVRRKRRGIKP